MLEKLAWTSVSLKMNTVQAAQAHAYNPDFHLTGQEKLVKTYHPCIWGVVIWEGTDNNISFWKVNTFANPSLPIYTFPSPSNCGGPFIFSHAVKQISTCKWHVCLQIKYEQILQACTTPCHNFIQLLGMGLMAKSLTFHS